MCLNGKGEALLALCVDERLRHRFIGTAGVTAAGEDLCKGFFVVDADELLVFGQCLLGTIIAVDAFGCGRSVVFVVDDGTEREAFRPFGYFVRPSQSDGGNRHDKAWQSEDVDDLAGIVDRGA